MEDKDLTEWNETLELIRQGANGVVSELSSGEFVTIQREVFEEMVQEINDFRMQNGDLGEGVDLIVLGEEGEVTEKTCLIGSED